MSQMSPPPDDKNWTWVLERPCPQCGFEAAGLHREDIGTRLLLAVRELREALAVPQVGVRPAPGVWSPLEYGCHTRDVCRVFLGRLSDMLDHDDPLYANWDQDATAVDGDYAAQEADVVGEQLWDEAQRLAGRFDGVDDGQWDRTGTRSDGAHFTIVSLGQYLVHDLVHHVWDLTGDPQQP